jgi:hypothetical protein
LGLVRAHAKAIHAAQRKWTGLEIHPTALGLSQLKSLIDEWINTEHSICKQQPNGDCCHKSYAIHIGVHTFLSRDVRFSSGH